MEFVFWVDSLRGKTKGEAGMFQEIITNPFIVYLLGLGLALSLGAVSALVLGEERKLWIRDISILLAAAFITFLVDFYSFLEQRRVEENLRYDWPIGYIVLLSAVFPLLGWGIVFLLSYATCALFNDLRHRWHQSGS